MADPIKFSELLQIVQEYYRCSRIHMRQPERFEEDRQKIKSWFEVYGVELDLDG